MTQRKTTISLALSLLLLLSIIYTTPLSAEDGFYSVSGTVYLDNVTAPAGIIVTLQFDNADDPNPDTIDSTGYYSIDWPGGSEYIGETGYYTLTYNNNPYTGFDEFGGDNMYYEEVLDGDIQDSGEIVFNTVGSAYDVDKNAIINWAEAGVLTPVPA